MALGPEFMVVRNVPVEGKANQVRLGGFDPDRLPVLLGNDSTIRFIEPDLARELKRQSTASRYFDRRLDDGDKEYIVWGVVDKDQPVGIAMLALDYREADFCTYSIVLHPSARNRGLGSLATAGVVQVGLAESALHDVSAWFDSRMYGIGTAIHSENLPSQWMCEGAGFELVPNEYYRIAGANFRSYLCERPAERPDLTVSRV